jgi:IS4 transposase
MKLHGSNNRRRYYLVIVKNKKRSIILLTSQRVENIEQAKKIVDIYSRRWLIEEYYRYIKQEYKLENIHLKE